MERSTESPIYVDTRNLTLTGVEPGLLRDLVFFKRTFTKLIKRDLKVDLVSKLQAHQFEPRHKDEGDGISAVGILGASHLGIHTWPERGVLKANFEFCSEQEELERLDQHMLERFTPLKMMSTQEALLDDGRTLYRDTSYLRNTQTPSGIFLYDAQRTNIITFSRTAHMMAQLEGRVLNMVEEPEKRVLGFELEVRRAA